MQHPTVHTNFPITKDLEDYCDKTYGKNFYAAIPSETLRQWVIKTLQYKIECNTPTKICFNIDQRLGGRLVVNVLMTIDYHKLIFKLSQKDFGTKFDKWLSRMRLDQNAYRHVGKSVEVYSHSSPNIHFINGLSVQQRVETIIELLIIDELFKSKFSFELSKKEITCPVKLSTKELVQYHLQQFFKR